MRFRVSAVYGPGERGRLEVACRQCRNRSIWPPVELALETGMRRGDLLRARWTDVSFETRTLHIPVTKNGYARTIPLTGRAVELLTELKCETASSGNVLQLTENMVKMAWERMVSRARLVDLRFHDLRHEAISRFFEKGLSVPEVALINGHRDARMLFRYTHPSAELIAGKLGRSEGRPGEAPISPTY